MEKSIGMVSRGIRTCFIRTPLDSYPTDKLIEPIGTVTYIGSLPHLWLGAGFLGIASFLTTQPAAVAGIRA